MVQLSGYGSICLDYYHRGLLYLLGIRNVKRQMDRLVLLTS